MSVIPKPCSNNSGITLLEIMISVAIIGILSSLTLSAFRPLISQYKLNSMARNMANNLLWARLKAISQHNNFIVKFYAPDDEGNYRYEIFSDDNYNGVRDAQEECREFSLGRQIQFASDQQIISPLGNSLKDSDGVTFSENSLTFAPRGSASESGSIYLVGSPSLNYNRCRALTVINTTGRIRTWQYCPEHTPIPWE